MRRGEGFGAISDTHSTMVWAIYPLAPLLYIYIYSDGKWYILVTTRCVLSSPEDYVIECGHGNDIICHRETLM